MRPRVIHKQAPEGHPEGRLSERPPPGRRLPGPLRRGSCWAAGALGSFRPGSAVTPSLRSEGMSPAPWPRAGPGTRTAETGIEEKRFPRLEAYTLNGYRQLQTFSVDCLKM